MRGCFPIRFLTIALTELLKREGLFMLHAAGLEVGGKGLLVAGQSGSGKIHPDADVGARGLCLYGR